MLKKIYSLTILLFLTISNFLTAGIDYEINDIDTLQTRESYPVALNNKGQVLGWYNIDGSKTGKHFFVRDKNKAFHELPCKENGVGWDINWRFLTDDGKAYGTFDGNANFAVLYAWDINNGVVKLGNLPGKEISAINNIGQVLIKSVQEIENGKSVIRPVVWKDGVVTKLKGLEGNIGIESDESYGFDINNRGDVVGRSVAYLNYKNNIYKQSHAVKWVNGQAIDLHKQLPKRMSTVASTINDLGDVVVDEYLICEDGDKFNNSYYSNSTSSNTKYFFKGLGSNVILDRFGKEIHVESIVNAKLYNDYDSIWVYCTEIVCINDNGEIIAKGKTIYDENHVMLLTPVKSD